MIPASIRPSLSLARAPYNASVYGYMNACISLYIYSYICLSCTHLSIRLRNCSASVWVGGSAVSTLALLLFQHVCGCLVGCTSREQYIYACLLACLHLSMCLCMYVCTEHIDEYASSLFLRICPDKCMHAKNACVEMFASIAFNRSMLPFHSLLLATSVLPK